MASMSSSVPSPLATAGPPASWTRVLLTSLSAMKSILYTMGTLFFYGIAYLVRSMAWTLSGLYAAAAWPLSRLLNFTRFALSPVTITVASVTSPIAPIFRFLGQLQPLYTFLGSAAVVGAVLGLMVAFASNYIVSALRLGPESEQDDFGESEAEGESRLLESAAPSQTSTKPSTKDGPPSQDDVWLWLEEFNPDRPNAGAPENFSAARQSKKQKHKPSVLSSQFIMEESS